MAGWKRFDLIVGKFAVKITTIYTRLPQEPENSIYLFGPRGTGKSTWIRGLFGDAVVYDILYSREAIRIERNPGVLFSEVESLPPGSWVVLDEVQTWKLKRPTKQISHPKLYVFDTGVARALSGRLSYPPLQEELGPLLENLIFNEIRAYLSYQKLHYQPSFWSSYDGTEVDFFCETRGGFVGVEIKASVNWQKKFGRGLLRLKREMAPAKVKSYGVYRGNRAARIEDIDILPVHLFLQMLWNGEIVC